MSVETESRANAEPLHDGDAHTVRQAEVVVRADLCLGSARDGPALHRTSASSPDTGGPSPWSTAVVTPSRWWTSSCGSVGMAPFTASSPGGTWTWTSRACRTRAWRRSCGTAWLRCPRRPGPDHGPPCPATRRSGGRPSLRPSSGSARRWRRAIRTLALSHPPMLAPGRPPSPCRPRRTPPAVRAVPAGGEKALAVWPTGVDGGDRTT